MPVVRKMDNLKDSEILEILKTAEEDGKWFSERYEELRIKYEGKVLAIRNKNVVGDATSTDELLKMIDKKGEDSVFVLIETIPTKDVSFIL